MDILGIIIICIVLYFVFQFVTTGHISVDVGHMNWVGIIIHSVFVGAMLYLIVSLFSQNPGMAKEWGLVGMGCIIGWNLLIASGLI